VYYITRVVAASIFGTHMRYTRPISIIALARVPLEESEFDHRNAKFMMRSVMRVMHNVK
jgi:hypothetical protein